MTLLFYSILEREWEVSFNALNSVHPVLQFTAEKESNGSLTFLDVLVETIGQKFITAVHRKPTFI